MAALVFPSSPTIGQLFPPSSGISGVSQWGWDGAKWNVIPPFVRTNNQNAYNGYVWPGNKSPTLGFQITDNLADGVLSWEIPGGPFTYLDDISTQFNGVQNLFLLTQGGVPYTPDPLTNIIIVLGGIVQTPGVSNAYTIVGSTINFTSAPPTGTSFYATTIRN